jgi:hypothetical protein
MAKHEMLIAKLSPQIANRMGLSSNHNARVWCTCMDHPLFPKETWKRRINKKYVHYPTRLGAFDALGVIDFRVENSAINLFRKHLKEIQEPQDLSAFDQRT